MRGFRATGLILLAGLTWVVEAKAQSDSSGLHQLPSRYVNGGKFQSTINPLPPVSQEPVPRAPNLPANDPSNPWSSNYQDPLRSGNWDDVFPCQNCCCQCNHWFGYLGGLVMSRNRSNTFGLTSPTGNPTDVFLASGDAAAGWSGGGEVTLGYSWAGSRGPAIAFTYWALSPLNGFANVTDPTSSLSTTINLNDSLGPMTIGGNPLSDYFVNCREQRIVRNDLVNNFEINLLQQNFFNTGRAQMTALAGFRYFRYVDALSFGSVGGGFNFGDNGGANEAYLDFRTVNNLYGGQVGVMFNYQIYNSVSWYLTPKAGIFGNQMVGRTHLYTGDGIEGFDIRSYKSDVAFLGEIDTGVSFALTSRLKAFIGYRVVAVANVALADNQILPYMADANGFAQVKQSGSLILHGAMAGVGWGF